MMTSLFDPCGTLAARFWAKVDKSDADGCWIWTGAGKGDYGRILIGSRKDGTRKIERASRVAWILAFGPIPEGQEVRHSCDNAGCVRQSHLLLGTHAENMVDMALRGRAPWREVFGAGAPNARLSYAETRAIVADYLGDGGTQKEVADRHGISQTHVSRLVRGEQRSAV